MGKKRAQEEAGLPEEEAAFPRGGGSGLAPIERKRLEQEAYAEAEADLAAEGRKGGKRHKKGAQGAAAADAGDEEDAFFTSLSSQDKLPKFVELLKFKSLSPGCKLWGAVIEVMPRELVVSLPHGLRGHVAYAEASDWLAEQTKKADKAEKAAAAAGGEEQAAGVAAGKKRKAAGGGGAVALPPLTELFGIGQLVRCTVTGLRGGGADGQAAEGAAGTGKKQKGADGKQAAGGKAKKRVDVSLRVSKLSAGLGPEAVVEGLALPAVVRSVEDHGFLLALGIKGMSGFLPKKEADAAGRSLPPGSLLEVVVAPGGVKPAGGGTTVVTVQCGHEAVAGAVAREWEGLNIGSLLPGQLVTARVRNVLSDGLLCSFLTYFSGTVDPFHLGTDLAADWRKQFSPNQRLRARVLWVDPVSKRVGLTLQRHLLGAGLPPNFPALGQVFEGAVVRRVDEGLGLLCELPTAVEGGAAAALPLTPGFAHISNLDDKKVEELGKRFRPGQHVRVRVLGFRPMDGLAVLSLKPSVVDQNILSLADLRPGMPVSGTVARVEEYGLLVSITPSIRALVPVLHASDMGTAKGLRKFKEGRKVAGKVLAVDAGGKKVTMTLKPSVVGSKFAPITGIQDAVPGARSHGVVTGVTDFGVFVLFFGGVTGLAHVSECGLAPGQKPAGSFQPGQVVKCRVLGADPGRKGLKLSLVTKKKAAGNDDDVATAGDAEVAGGAGVAAADAAKQPGEKAEKKKGNGAASAEDAEAEAAAAQAAMGEHRPGEVVWATVAGLRTKEVDGAEAPAFFDLAVYPTEEAAAAVTPGAAAAGAAAGRLEIAHLADHPTAAAALLAVLKPGMKLGPLLVLQRLENVRQLRLTRKESLLSAAQAGVLPASLEAVAEGAVLPGYVASVTRDAVFVRFLDGLTGRAGLAQLSDTFVSDPHLFFREGQSVRATVVQVERERERFSVALKQSLCGSRDAALLRSLFSDLEAVEALRASSEELAAIDWSPFPIGTLVPGEVHEVQAYGLVCDLEANPDIVGLVGPEQLPQGAPQEPGTSVCPLVLDVNKAGGVVELSLQPRLLRAAEAAAAAAQQEQQPAKKKQKKQKGAEGKAADAAAAAALQEGQQVEVTIEMVKEDEGYCVVSLAGVPGQRHALGFLPTSDFNLQGKEHARQFAVGDTLSVSVAALPGAATGGRLLLSAPLTAKPLRAAGGRAGTAGAAAGSGKGQAQQRQQPTAPAVGSVVEATVGVVHPLYAELELKGGCHGRLHITEAAPPAAANGAAPAAAEGAAAAAAAEGGSNGSPLSALSSGATLRVVVMGRVQTTEGRRHGLLECSSRPEILAAAKERAAAKTGSALPQRPISWGRLKPGQQLSGYVAEVDGSGYVWCAFTPAVRGRAFAAQACSSIEECRHLRQRFKPGQPVQATVVHADAKRHALDVSLQQADATAGAAAAPAAGSVVLGRITSVGGGGVRVQLSTRCAGRVALTDIHDAPVQQALAGLQVGQYCRAAVLASERPEGGSKGGSKGGEGEQQQLLLSLRPSAGGQCAAHAAAAAAEQQGGDEAPKVAAGPLQPGQLKPGQKVAGYVKSAGTAGVFVCLARNLDARIRLNQLADGFVDKPAEAFPEGKLVEGQVLKTEGDRVDLTLRSRKVGPSLESLEEGQVVRGHVKRVTKFGVFVELEGAEAQGATGLAHVSEVADEFVKDLSSLFNSGQRVVARVLKVDAAGGKLSLGLKPSYFEDLSDLEELAGEEGAAGEGDFDAELEAAAGASSDEEADDDEGGSGGSSGSEEEDEAAGEGSGSEEVGGEADGEDEEDFDLDEDLAGAESDSGEEE